MAHTVIKGLTGSLTLPGSIGAKLNAVSISTGANLVDISGFGGAGWVERTTLLSDLTGEASGFMETEHPFMVDDGSTQEGTMLITFKSGYTLSFPCIIGNIQSSVRYDGVNVVSFTYAYNGDGTTTPTLTWNGS